MASHKLIAPVLPLGPGFKRFDTHTGYNVTVHRDASFGPRPNQEKSYAPMPI
jgi:hypothetical protein